MAQFTYSARNKAGTVVTANLEAPSRKEALRLLAARGFQVQNIFESGEGKAVKPAKKDSKSSTENSLISLPTGKGGVRPRRKDRLPFLESLYDLTASGLSAGEAIRLLSVRLKDPALKALCQSLWEQISEGAPLSRAMANMPEVFDASSVNLIASGETTGSLSDTLKRLIEHLHEQRELRRNLISALIYPVFMMFMAGGVILFFLFYLLPRMQSLLTSLGGKMPISTRMLIFTSEFVLHYGIFVVIGLAIFSTSFWRWRLTQAGRTATDTWMLKIPFVGSFVTAQTIYSISQTLAVLLENGITTAEALKMTERQISNMVHREAFTRASARVLEGESLSLALGRMKCFPDLILDRLAVGENTGNIVPSLKDIAISNQKLLSRQLHGLTRVIASAVLAAVFIFVGFIAFAIVSAVFQLSASINMR